MTRKGGGAAKGRVFVCARMRACVCVWGGAGGRAMLGQGATPCYNGCTVCVCVRVFGGGGVHLCYNHAYTVIHTGMLAMEGGLLFVLLCVQVYGSWLEVCLTMLMRATGQLVTHHLTAQPSTLPHQRASSG